MQDEQASTVQCSSCSSSALLSDNHQCCTQHKLNEIQAASSSMNSNNNNNSSSTITITSDTSSNNSRNNQHIHHHRGQKEGGLSALPNEIYLHIFSFAIDPFSLLGSVASIRHVNKCWFELTETEFFWQEIIVKLLRQKMMIVDGEKAIALYEELELQNDEDFDELMQELTNRFYKTHEFIDELIQSTRRSRYSTRYNKSDKFLRWKRFDNEDSNEEYESEEEEEDDIFVGPNLFDKSKEWIDSFGEEHHAGNVLLQACMEIILGHEMIEHLGMKTYSTFIQQFFLKLFEPAIELVKMKNESGAGFKLDMVDLDKTPILNRNLLKFMQENGRCTKLFKQQVTTHWNTFDELYCTIPRQYILFMAEHFSRVRVREGDCEMNAVKYVCKSLRDCGLKIEDLCFMGDNLMPNFEYTSGLKSMIRSGSAVFLLSHLAVWTENYELLDWALTVKNREGDATLYDVVTSTLAEHINAEQMEHIDRVIPKDLTVKSYIMAHLSPLNVKTYLLNEALMMNNVEMVRHLCDKYLCNPFGPWEHKYSSPLQYALMQSMHASLSKNNSEQKIVEILEKKYGQSDNYKTELEISKKLSAQRRVTPETCSLCCGTDKIALAYEKKYGGVYKPNAEEENYEHIELKRNVVLEEERAYVDKKDLSIQGDQYDGTESDEDDTEESMSIPWLRHYINNKKRKRVHNDPAIDEMIKEKELMKPIKEIISNFETVDQEIDFADDDYYSQVKALERTWDRSKRIKLDEDAPNEKFTTTRDTLCFSKLNFREVLHDALKRQMTGVFITPHAKMLIQQATEDFIEHHIYRLNNDMTYGEPSDTQTAQAKSLFTDQHMGILYYRYQKFRNCDIQDQLSTFTFGRNNLVFEEIAKHLNTLIDEEDEDEQDLDYLSDNVSVNSDDSMLSCTALEFGECKDELFAMPQFMVYTDLENLKHSQSFVGEDGYERALATEIHKNTKHHIVMSSDPELVTSWADNIHHMGTGLSNNEHNLHETRILQAHLEKNH